MILAAPCAAWTTRSQSGANDAGVISGIERAAFSPAIRGSARVAEVVIFFEDHVQDENVKAAMRAARNLRRALKQAEGVKIRTKASRVYDRTST